MYRSSEPKEKYVQRFLSVDPLSEVSRRWSPYGYGADNPIRYIDVDGMFFDDYQLSKDGSVQLLQKTDDATDKLYASKENGDIDKENSIDDVKSIPDKK